MIWSKTKKGWEICLNFAFRGHKTRMGLPADKVWLRKELNFGLAMGLWIKLFHGLLRLNIGYPII